MGTATDEQRKNAIMRRVAGRYRRGYNTSRDDLESFYNSRFGAPTKLDSYIKQLIEEGRLVAPFGLYTPRPLHMWLDDNPDGTVAEWVAWLRGDIGAQ